MLGVIADAEDATQEILIKVMTHIGLFRQECSLSTWIFRIAVNHLKDCQKNIFARYPLSFEMYGEDISSGRECDYNILTSCTNAMEKLDNLSQIFANFPAYHSPNRLSRWIQEVMKSKHFFTILNGQEETV